MRRPSAHINQKATFAPHMKLMPTGSAPFTPGAPDREGRARRPSPRWETAMRPLVQGGQIGQQVGPFSAAGQTVILHFAPGTALQPTMANSVGPFLFLPSLTLWHSAHPVAKMSRPRSRSVAWARCPPPAPPRPERQHGNLPPQGLGQPGRQDIVVLDQQQSHGPVSLLPLTLPEALHGDVGVGRRPPDQQEAVEGLGTGQQADSPGGHHIAIAKGGIGFG